LEYRALLETYHDLRTEHTAWVQRIHAVFFHQGPPRLGEGALRTERGLAGLRAAAAAHLSPAGQLQVATAVDMIAAVEARMGPLRRQLLDAARHLAGAKVLAARLYGAGPITALALTCWLGGAGRFSSSRKAVRFTGLDITVWSSDRKGPPGRLSRQGPPVLRWAVYEAGKTHARTSAPDHGYYAQVKDRKNGKLAASVRGPQDRPAGLPHPGRARRRRAHHRLTAPTPHGSHAEDTPDPGRNACSHTHPMGNHRGQLL
jgi:transposase